MMETFRRMTNDCIRLGLEYDLSSMKRLSKLCYHKLQKYDIAAYYKLCAISRAAGILSNRKKSLARGFPTKDPCARKPLLVAYFGFKVQKEDGILKIPLRKREYLEIRLNDYAKLTLSDPFITVKSFTISEKSLSICYSKEVNLIECTNTVGIDRNLSNLTVGNASHIVQYDISRAVDIAENTRSIVRSFRRNDTKIRRRLYAKYGQRRKNRINQLLHNISKHVVRQAVTNNEAIVFEDLTQIRKLYQRGNYQGSNYRAKMNAWPFHEAKRQTEYKAAWEGIPVIGLPKSETRGTSKRCPRCGKRTQEAARGDRIHYRQLWCPECEIWIDRDIVAAMNLSVKGLARFASSQGLAGEAMKGNPTMPVILRVDASKLSFRRS